MPFKRSWLVALSLAVGCGAVDEAAAQKHGYVRGSGASYCGAYKEAYDAFRPYATTQDTVVANSVTGTFLQYQAWAHGYLLGIDIYNNKEIADFDNSSMNLWLSNYCLVILFNCLQTQ